MEYGEILAALADDGVSITQLVREIVQDESSTPESISVRLVGFLLECAGTPADTVRSALRDQDEAPDENDIVEIEKDEVDDIASDIASDRKSFFDKYPLQHWKQFSSKFARFWEALIAESDTTLSLIDDSSAFYQVLPALVRSVVALSVGPMLSFRHTAVETAAHLGKALLSLFNAELVKLFKVVKQLASKVKRASPMEKLVKDLKRTLAGLLEPTSKFLSTAPIDKALEAIASAASKSQKPVADLATSCLRMTASLKRLNGMAQQLFNGMFHSKVNNRCKDIHDEVRLASLHVIEAFMQQDPVHFIWIARVHVDRLLSDRSPAVRKKACEVWRVCMLSAGPAQDLELDAADRKRSDQSLLKKKSDWASRALADELGGPLLSDVNAGVIESAIRAVSAIFEVNRKSVEMSTEQAVERCLCYMDTAEESLAGVRLAAAEFALKSRPELVGDARASGSARTGAAGLAQARLQLASLLELLANLAGSRQGSKRASTDKDNNDDGNMEEDDDELDDDDDDDDEYDDDIDSEIGYEELREMAAKPRILPFEILAKVVQAFWALPECDFLRNWEAQCNMLQSYGENNVSGNLGALRAQTLAGIIRAASDCIPEQSGASGKSARGGNRRKSLSAAAKKDATTMARALHEAVERSLTDLVVTFRAEPAVLRNLIPLCAKLDLALYTRDSQRKKLAKLTKSLSQVFLQHMDPVLLFETGRILAGVLASSETSPVGKEANTILAEMRTGVHASIAKAGEQFKDGAADEETWTALANGVRRIGMLLRVDAETEPLEIETQNNVCNALCTCGRKEAVLLADGLVALQLDLVAAFRAAASACEDKEKLESACADVVRRRDALARVLEHVFDTYDSPRKLQQAAIATLMDMRVLCARRLESTALHALAWRPSKPLVAAADAATRSFVDRAAKAGSRQQPSMEMQRLLVAPAVRSALYSGSALAGYLVAQAGHGNQDLDDAADVLQNTARKSDTESLMVMQHEALRVSFVAQDKDGNGRAEEDENDEGDEKGLFARAASLAREISARAHNCPERMAPPLIAALEEDFAFALAATDDNASLGRVGFLALLVPFVRILKPHQLHDVRQVWSAQINESTSQASAIMKLLLSEDEPNGDLDENLVRRGRAAFRDLEAALGVRTQTGAKSDKDGDVVVDDDDDDDDEEEESDMEEKNESKSSSASRRRSAASSQSSKRRTPKSRQSSTSTSSARKRRKVVNDGKDGNEEEEDDDDVSAREIEKNLFAASDSETGRTASRMGPQEDALFSESGVGAHESAHPGDEDEDDVSNDEAVKGVRPRRRSGRMAA
ncbi:Hypothetical Protein FCC1311_076442 [Hondaea fermentalgiana]|uniref:Uncharacterized protein n=1 Tax=Hondaea fermentalgiana TaxID=2315210 RepID=A0A2R5GKL6_9STRA|nr:Hypothetical Protein FCC1311_076442 [Hondaea fermentalgiana]|eukprot:GBG31420.1 Hypothetical Protein FCC1311_076442 [Hondaea fermentalgiana]